MAAALAVLAAGCTDFPTPAELSKPTIIAVVAEPPVVEPGGSTTLTVVVADATGQLSELPCAWATVEPLPGVGAIGTVTAGADGAATFTAPDPMPELPENVPPVASVQVSVTTADGPLVALKGVPVVDVAGANPTITAVELDGVDALAGPVTAKPRGATIALEVITEPALGDDARIAWYSTVGEIEHYQSNPSEMLTPAEADAGPLFIVVRDGRGGVAWTSVDVAVE